MSRADDIRSTQRILDVSPGVGQTTDMTSVIDTLGKTGIPGIESTTLSQLTLGDDRVAPVTNDSPFWPALCIGQNPPRHDRVFFDDARKSNFSKGPL